MEKRDPLKEVANTSSNNDPPAAEEPPKPSDVHIAPSTSEENKENGVSKKLPKSDPEKLDVGAGTSKPKDNKPRRSILKAFDPLYPLTPEKSAETPSEDSSAKLKENPSQLVIEESDGEEEPSFVDASSITEESSVEVYTNLHPEESLLQFCTPDKTYVAHKGKFSEAATTSQSSETDSVLQKEASTSTSDSCINPEECIKPEEPECVTLHPASLTESQIVSAITRKLSSDCDIIPTRSRFTITESELENYNTLRERYILDPRDPVYRPPQESAADAIEHNSLTSVSEIRNISPERSHVSVQSQIDGSFASTSTVDYPPPPENIPEVSERDESSDDSQECKVTVIEKKSVNEVDLGETSAIAQEAVEGQVTPESSAVAETVLSEILAGVKSEASAESSETFEATDDKTEASSVEEQSELSEIYADTKSEPLAESSEIVEANDHKTEVSSVGEHTVLTEIELPQTSKTSKKYTEVIPAEEPTETKVESSDSSKASEDEEVSSESKLIEIVEKCVVVLKKLQESESDSNSEEKEDQDKEESSEDTFDPKSNGQDPDKDPGAGSQPERESEDQEQPEPEKEQPSQEGSETKPESEQKGSAYEPQQDTVTEQEKEVLSKEISKEESEQSPPLTDVKTEEPSSDSIKAVIPIEEKTEKPLRVRRSFVIEIEPDEELHLDSGVDSTEESYKSPKSQLGDSEGSEKEDEQEIPDKAEGKLVITNNDVEQVIDEQVDDAQCDEPVVVDELAKTKSEEQPELITDIGQPKIIKDTDNLTDKQKAEFEALKVKMADLSEKLSQQQQENSDLKLQLNAIQQAKASLELEIRQKEEIIIKTQAEALKNEQTYKQEIKQLREKLKENSKLIEKDGSKELEEQLKEAKAREAKAVAELNQRTKDDLNYQKIMEEYENTIATRFTDYQKLKEEHEIATRHLANIELAFSDVHQKYERTKGLLEGFKANEEALNTALQSSETLCKQHEERYESLKAHAKGQIEKCNKEILMLRDKYEMDVNKLKAIIKRLEIKCSSLQVSLQQKNEECAALSALCDEVTGKKV